MKAKMPRPQVAAGFTPSPADFLEEIGSPGIDRKSWIKLPYQVAGILRRAIADDVWAPGEKLPSARTLASGFGVSFRVAVEALRILAGENRISLRAKSRALVNVEVSELRNHRVLLVRPGGVFEYADMAVYEQLRTRLKEAGYLVMLTTLSRVGPRNRYDIAQLRADLRQPYELVVCPRTKPHVLDIIKSSGQRFAIVPGMAVAAEKCAGNIACDTGPAAADFAGHCRRRKIRRVMIVAKWRGDGAGIQAALAAEGIAAEVMIVRAKVCVFRGESIERLVFDAFSRRFAREGKSWLPEVLYFTDDFACYGAMNAMLTHAVRVPEDVRVATVANRGSLRAYKTSLTRIEYDLRDMGDAAAGILLSYLRSGVFTENAAVRPVFRVGGSFR